MPFGGCQIQLLFPSESQSQCGQAWLISPMCLRRLQLPWLLSLPTLQGRVELDSLEEYPLLGHLFIQDSLKYYLHFLYPTGNAIKFPLGQICDMDISTEFLKPTFVSIGDNGTPINSTVNVFQDIIPFPTCHLHKQMLMKNKTRLQNSEINTGLLVSLQFNIPIRVVFFLDFCFNLWRYCWQIPKNECSLISRL